MFIHHLATISLISFSYVNNMVRVGSLVMCVHDSSDFLLEVSRTLRWLWSHIATLSWSFHVAHFKQLTTIQIYFSSLLLRPFFASFCRGCPPSSLVLLRGPCLLKGSFFLATVTKRWLMGELLGLCKWLNQGIWSRLAQFGKCHKMTFIMNWHCTTELYRSQNAYLACVIIYCLFLLHTSFWWLSLTVIGTWGWLHIFLHVHFTVWVEQRGWIRLRYFLFTKLQQLLLLQKPLRGLIGTYLCNVIKKSMLSKYILGLFFLELLTDERQLSLLADFEWIVVSTSTVDTVIG